MYVITNGSQGTTKNLKDVLAVKLLTGIRNNRKVKKERSKIQTQ